MISRIGRYQVQEELGRGGFGRVFRAYDPTVGRPVAIKTLNTSGEQDMLIRFRNEAAAAGRLHHQNIVIVFDFGEHDGSPFLVMELLDGEDVERIISNNRPLTLLKKLDVIMQAAAGLHHAHSKGIVHRDVKPANIMVLTDGTVKIMDFGIALLTQATADRITPQGSMIGTLPYMAPEQFFGAGSSVMTDIFAFGVTCYKLLTGVHPFHAAELGSMMNNIANQQPSPLRNLNPECPEALEQVIGKLLAKNPDLRYQSLEDAQFDLEPIIIDLRKENLGELIAETRNLIAAENLESAQSKVREVFEIDPGNRTARELRETIQRQIKDRAVRPKITALVSAGREQLGVRQFDEAIQKFESALLLDKANSELQELVQQARAASERARRADRLLDEAQQAIHRDDLTAAHKSVTEALSTDPEHDRAEVLLGDVRQRIESRRRDQQLQDGLNHVKGLMLLQNFPDAIEAGARLHQEFPESSEARRILERARQELEAQNRRERLQQGIVEAKALLKSRRLADATQRLSQLQTEFPESAELRDLAAYTAGEVQAEQQARVLAQVTAETQTLVAAGDFDTALERLKSVMAEHPGLNALRDLVQSVTAAKAQHQRDVALNEAVRASTTLLEASRFSEAIERIESFTRAYGDSSALNLVRQQAEEGLERQRQAVLLRKLLADAQALLDEGKPSSAAQLLQQASVQFSGNSEVVNLLTVARNKLREQQQAEEISKIISEAESLARLKRFDQALTVLNEGQKKYPTGERLTRCREAIQASQAAHERERIRRETLDRVRHLHSKGKRVEAIEAIDTALLNGIEDDALLVLKRQIETEIADKRRADAIAQTLTSAQGLLDEDRLDAAIEILQEANRLYPAEARLATLLNQALARLQQRRRAEAIAKTLRDVEGYLRNEDFDQAVRTIDEAARQHGPDDALAQSRNSALAAKAAHEALIQQQRRAEGIAKAIRAANEHTDGKAFDRAIKLLDDAVRQHGPDDTLAQARATALSAKAAHEALLQQQERAEGIAKAVQTAEGHARSKDFDRALRLLDEALRKFGTDAALLQSRDSALAGKAAQERATALADARTRVGKLQKAGRLPEAIQAVDGAIQQLGEDSTLLSLKRSLEAELETRKRDEEAQGAIRQAKDFLGKDDPASAIQCLKQAPARSAHQDQIDQLLGTAEAKLEEQRRDRAIAAIVEEVNKVRAKGQFDQALRNLERGVQQFPGVELLTRLRESLIAEKARAESLAQANRLHREGRFDAALQEVQEALIAVPADSELLQLKSKIESDQAKQKQAIEVAKAVKQAQAMIQADRLEEALPLLQLSIAHYPGEKQVSELLRKVEEDLHKRRRAKELAEVQAQAETLLSQRRFEDVVKLIEGRFPKEPAFADMLRRAQQEVDAARREEMIQQAITIGREKRYEEAIKVVEQAESQYGSTETTEKLRHSLRSSLEFHLRRHARERDQAQLLSIEQQIGTGLRKSKLKKLAAEAQTISARYADDPEIGHIAGRILQTAATAPAPKPFVSPRILIAGGVGVALLIGGIAFFSRTPEPTPVATIPIDIHTDPPGASIHIDSSNGDGIQSCVTPNCRFGLKPGNYRLEAKLNGFETIQQSLNVEAGKGTHVVGLTLRPVPIAPPLPADNSVPTGTLLVRTEVPDAIVYIDGTARGRTDRSGSLSLPLEAKTHVVHVERIGYDMPPPQKVVISKGEQQVVSFTLVLQSAKLELVGAPRGVEMRVSGKLLGTSNGSTPLMIANIAVGDQLVQITLGAANRSVQKRFESGQTVRIDWKDVDPGPPPPNPEAIDRQDWERVRTSSDVAQLRIYLSAHPTGSHARDATSRIADLIWAGVDQSNIEAVRRFVRENPDNPHKNEAQKILDQYDATQQRLAQERDKQEKAKQEQVRQEQVKQEQARQEQAKLDQAKLEQAKAQAERNKLEQARIQQVMGTLGQLDSAIQRKRPTELKALWPNASPMFLDSVGNPQAEMSLLPTADVQFPQGDRAVVHCDLVVRTKASGSTAKHQKVTVTLHNVGNSWTVDLLKVD